MLLGFQKTLQCVEGAAPILKNGILFRKKKNKKNSFPSFPSVEGLPAHINCVHKWEMTQQNCINKQKNVNEENEQLNARF